MLRGRALPVILTVIMLLTIGLMMLAPASAGAFPGKNGKIAFFAILNVGDLPQIFVMNPDGTERQQLTPSSSTILNAHPTWSPDGTKIAYTSGPVGVSSIWIMNADGSGAHQLTSGTLDRTPDWSPDRALIAYTDTANNLAVMNADGTGALTELTTGGQFDTGPAWSPDGTKIAFQRGPHIFVLTVATLSVTQLSVSGTTFEVQPCWSPDGSKIVFFGVAPNAGVYVVDANGGTATLLLSGQYQLPYWSPDGTKIAVTVVTPVMRIYVMNADGSGLTGITSDMLLASVTSWQRIRVIGAPVGGFIEPVNNLAVFAPYLALFGVISAVVVVVWKKPRND